jgi:hypothetical protein
MELCSNRGGLYVRVIQNRPAFPLTSLNRTSDICKITCLQLRVKNYEYL